MAKNENKLWEDRMQTLFDYNPKKGIVSEFVVLPNGVDEDGEEDPNAAPAPAIITTTIITRIILNMFTNILRLFLCALETSFFCFFM